MNREITMTRDEVRLVDRTAIEWLGLPGIALMENAGRSAAEILQRRGAIGPVWVCTGSGNNGGDGFVIARHLWLAGIEVRILQAADPERLKGDALINHQVAAKLGLELLRYDDARDRARWLAERSEADWIVDALLGTGVSSDVRSPYDGLIREINESGACVLAVDLPSGLDCDRGEPLGCAVSADVTVTFVSRKAGFEAESSKEFTGDVVVAGIGVPADLAGRAEAGD